MEYQTLANQKFEITRGNYKEPTDFLMEFPSVFRVIWTGISSSAGNWGGVIAEKAGDNQYNLLDFCQIAYFGGEIACELFIGEPMNRFLVCAEDIDKVVDDYCSYSYNIDFEYDEYSAERAAKISKNENYVSLEIPF